MINIRDLLRGGHIDLLSGKRLLGADPIRAIKMGTLHTAQYFGLKNWEQLRLDTGRILL